MVYYYYLILLLLPLLSLLCYCIMLLFIFIILHCFVLYSVVYDVLYCIVLYTVGGGGRGGPIDDHRGLVPQFWFKKRLYDEITRNLITLTSTGFRRKYEP